jgi:uncharacterized protein YoxC
MITLDNKKIHDHIVKKDALVNDGRKVSKDIDEVEKEIAIFETKEREITSKVNPLILKAKGDRLNDECQKKFEELQDVIKQIEDIRLAAIPAEMRDAHMALMKKRESLERDRNKIFLKVQKIKDLVVPIIQKEVKPLLQEYDDIETAKTKDGKVVIETFNHLADFKKKFKK